MKKCNYILTLLTLSTLLPAAAPPGVPRDSNTNNTGGYDGTRVEAQLIVPLKEGADSIHFIRDNNDPRVITKCYHVKNVDAYNFRDFLRMMVQSKRVGNTSMIQQYPANVQNTATVNGNTVTLPVTSTVTSPVLNSVASQLGYNPTAQLGSNTAVECLKFADGTGLLLVSAEEYRFKDHPNGMGIDTLISTLDDPALGAISYGNPFFIYMPKFVPARNLQPMIQNVGMNISDVTELWQGQDLVAYDPDLNWLIFDVENYSAENIAQLLKEYDVPIPQVRIKITVYEIDSENDDKMGIDFQSWKNNQGTDFFSVGGRYRNNWNALYDTTGLNRAAGSERSSFYNFNPKWNSRYLDFLTSIGKARVMLQSEIAVRNATTARVERLTHIFYSDSSQPAPNSTAETVFPNTGVGPYELLNNIIGSVAGEAVDPNNPIRVGKGNQQQTALSQSYGFTMNISDLAVGLKETRFTVQLNNTSLLGFQSNGAPRIAPGTQVMQNVSLPHGVGEFAIGGLKKQSQVTSRSGIPWLMDIPYLGYLFSSVSKSIKHTELLVVGQLSYDAIPTQLPVKNHQKFKRGRADSIKKKP